jgi:hypothetical protein
MLFQMGWGKVEGCVCNEVLSFRDAIEKLN